MGLNAKAAARPQRINLTYFNDKAITKSLLSEIAMQLTSSSSIINPLLLKTKAQFIIESLDSKGKQREARYKRDQLPSPFSFPNLSHNFDLPTIESAKAPILELVIKSIVVMAASNSLAIQLLTSTATSESKPDMIFAFSVLISSAGITSTLEIMPIKAS